MEKGNVSPNDISKVSSIAYACILRDMTAEFNVLSKLMQHPEIEGYQIVDVIEQPLAF